MKTELKNKIYKITVLILLILITIISLFQIQNLKPIQNSNSGLRVMCGNYHNWKVVETVDGNVWMINREFEENQLVQILFDTKGTDAIIDDEILYIREVK